MVELISQTTLEKIGVRQIKIKCNVIQKYKPQTQPPGNAKDFHATYLTALQATSVFPINCTLCQNISVNIFLHFSYQPHHFHSAHITQHLTRDLFHSKEELPDLCVLYTKNYLGDQIRKKMRGVCNKGGACSKGGVEGYRGLEG